MSERPLFSVGEEVLIYSKVYPDVQGFGCVVTKVLDREPRVNINGDTTLEFNYFVFPDPINSTFPWGEQALRKKYLKGDDYKTMMDKLKIGEEA